jgi:hypothetical protein
MEAVEAFAPGLASFWNFTDPFVQFWQSIFHLPDDMMRLCFCLIFALPMALLHRHVVPGTTARMVFSLLVGLFFVFFCFKWDALYFVVSGLVTYLIAAVVPSKYSPQLIILFSFGVLTYG